MIPEPAAIQPLIVEALDPTVDPVRKACLLSTIGQSARDVQLRNTVRRLKDDVAMLDKNMKAKKVKTTHLKESNVLDIDPRDYYGSYFTSDSRHFTGGLDLALRFAIIRLNYTRLKNVKGTTGTGFQAAQLWGELGSLLLLDMLTVKESFGEVSLFGSDANSKLPIIQLYTGNNCRNIDLLIGFFVELVGKTSTVDEHKFAGAFKTALTNALKNIRRYLGEGRTQRVGQKARTLDYYLRFLPTEESVIVYEDTERCEDDAYGAVDTARPSDDEIPSDNELDDEEDGTVSPDARSDSPVADETASSHEDAN